MTPAQGHVVIAILEFLVSALGPPLLAYGAGILIVRVLYWWRLRWTWVLLGVPLAYLAWFVQWQLGLMATIATWVAIRHGYRLCAEVLQHGGEEAREEEDTRSPLGWLWGRLASRRERRVSIRAARLPIGRTRGGRVCRVPMGGANHGAHGLVLGATGSGKTVTQAAIAQSYIYSGQGAIVIDPKGDADLRETLYGAAQEVGAGFRTWAPTGSCIYKPLARGTVTEIADKALSAHQWSEPHYELVTQRLLGHVLTTMQAAELWPPTLSQLAIHMDPDRLDALAREVGGKTRQRVRAYLDGLSPRARSDLGGGRDRLAVLAEGELGPLLDPALGDGELLDLCGAISAGDVIYFAVDADRYPAASRLLASALVIDLVTLSAELQGAGHRGLVLIDEFAALAADQVSRLFARARSAGISLLLGAQSLGDLRAARVGAPDTLVDQVLDNIGYLVSHRIGHPGSAELLAAVAGTVPSWSMTERTTGEATMLPTGEGTRTRSREFAIGPDEFKTLGKGQAVVIDHSAKRRRAQRVRIWPPRPTQRPRAGMPATSPREGEQLVRS